MSDTTQNAPDRHLSAAEGYLELGMPEHARRELEVHARLWPPDSASCHLLGEVLRALGDHPAAIEEYQRALCLGPPTTSTLLGLAWSLKRTGNLGRAIEVTERAYEIDADNAVVLYNLACYYALAGDKELALSWLGRAIRREQRFRALVGNEADFDEFRQDPDFQFVIGELEEED